MMTEPIISVERLRVRYGHGRSSVMAVDGVSLAIGRGTSHGLVGESGSGKSTLARAIMGLAPIWQGDVKLEGRTVHPGSSRDSKQLRSMVQMVFQNPYASLNPRMTVQDMMLEAMSIHQPQLQDKHGEAASLLQQVGLGPDAAESYPHQFSGGQRQRIAIARALATAAPVLILDEVTSALDVSVQAAVLNLLKTLQRERGLSYLFISHDLAAVRYLCDTASVMYLGQIVETAPRDVLFQKPQHPYTSALLASVPKVQVASRPAPPHLSGEIGDPRNPPSGCRFHPRCPIAQQSESLMQKCRTSAPELGAGPTSVACHAPAAHRFKSTSIEELADNLGKGMNHEEDD